MPPQPVLRLRIGDIELSPLSRTDRGAYQRLRRDNEQWLRPWDGRNPYAAESVPESSRREFRRLLRSHAEQVTAGTGLALGVRLGGALVGQISVNGIMRGPLWSASIGYWIDEGHAGRGITSAALKLVCGHCFGELGLHRLDMTIQPSNARSLAVARRVGFHYEGLHRRYLYADGEWRDHECWALLADEWEAGANRH